MFIASMKLKTTTKLRFNSGSGFYKYFAPNGANHYTYRSGVDARRFYFNFSFSRSFTTFGLALPFEAFITWPTKNPNKVSLPARYCSS